jgi:hypothetical protein
MLRHNTSLEAVDFAEEDITHNNTDLTGNTCGFCFYFHFAEEEITHNNTDLTGNTGGF